MTRLRTDTAIARERELRAIATSNDSPIEQLDAIYECVHGRLPGDRTAPCGCFTTPREIRP